MTKEIKKRISLLISGEKKAPSSEGGKRKEGNMKKVKNILTVNIINS
ncbi:hypothetical protein [Desulfosporosinus orientis]|nr:hypothetical protein [Desulfosporosinus orientis]